MGAVSPGLFGELRDALDLQRAVETGTFEGNGTVLLAQLFPSVVTIELSEFCYTSVKPRLDNHANIEIILGDSRDHLPPLVRPDVATLYFLDGHWCEGPDGADNQCPILDELAALQGGHRNDCIVIDDARFFLAAPPPPYDPDDWPTLLEVLGALQAAHPQHHVTVLSDQIIAVPVSAKPIVDRFGQQLGRSPLRGLRRRLLGNVLGPWSPTRRALRRMRQRASDSLQRKSGEPLPS